MTTKVQDLALREFHISRQARDRYQFDETLFTQHGNVVFANFHAARRFAQRLNAQRDLAAHPEQAVRAGEINALGLMDEVLHYVIRQYQKIVQPQVLGQAIAALEASLGREAVDQALLQFCEEFPPAAVYRGEMTAREYLQGQTENTPHREVALEELLLLWITNLNPACDPLRELFDDAHLEQATAYRQIMRTLEQFFEEQPRFGPENQTLIALLRTPALRAPHSLEAQLDFIRRHWLGLIAPYLHRLLRSLDFLTEESKLFFGFGPGPETFQPYEFTSTEEEEIENFSPDSDWMPRLVLLAKNAYVWLDQLTKEYDRPIVHLDQVPDEELDKLARRGFTGLWLIGLWQRSTASKRIKQRMGNPEAVASAYSLDDYRIADDLGGEAAYEALKARAMRRGIRMASDMVPNHMGIDSRWVIEHPDWFISLDYAPFPGYSYQGPDLCDDPRVGIYLEDHYYERSDAAVTFKRVDHWTGDTRYIYHGNDGTSMPWNDTAQLNYLKPEVREAVIRTILAVARRSPIIRFDAAMTLTKKHYQRLWFPEPGHGGDIPSRAEFGMTKAEFDRAMPQEFWREVVDRVAAEAPDTLLLAEAFWLMEGYFVRTLGMHRVYNSAFMNMLRDEKNAAYRQLIKNTLEFDPQILKRYVNFMNNPDERTAVDQFGKGDKYFGVCTMMVTLPGLPMFGHGQVEGYAEKYGMEFRRAYWDESPDPWLVERHTRQIAPLLHRRALFAEVEHFYLYDFYTADGSVDENVFAYSNKWNGERSLVLYHNKYAETAGWIRSTAAYAVKDPDGEKHLEQRTLAQALDLPPESDAYLIFRDAVTGLEYIRSVRTLGEQGLYAQLSAYQAQVFVDFREVRDNEWGQYGQLTRHLNGRGVPSISEALRELLLEPIYAPFRMLVSAPAFRWLLKARTDAEDGPINPRILTQVEQKVRDLLTAVAHAAPPQGDIETLSARTRRRLALLLTLETHLAAADPAVQAYLLAPLQSNAPDVWGTLLSWLFVRPMGELVDETHGAELSAEWLDEWLLGKRIAAALEEVGLDAGEAWRAVTAVKILLRAAAWLPDNDDPAPLHTLLHRAFQSAEVRSYLGVNRHRGILWFNKEAFEQWVWWLNIRTALDNLDAPQPDIATLERTYRQTESLLNLAGRAAYQVDALLEGALASATRADGVADAE